MITLCCGFGAIYLLPKSPALQSSALPGGLKPEGAPWELPHVVGDWRGGASRKASDKEVAVLAIDTKFAKKSYVRAGSDLSLETMRNGAIYEEAEVSIVTSGADMNASIHRPERCLDAQGFDIIGQESMTVSVRGMPLPVKKLMTVMRQADPKDSSKVYEFHNVTYYWFVGHTQVTNDHTKRSLLDMKDRVLKGYDQEWAYATVGIMLEPHPVVLEEGKAGDKPVMGYTHPIDNVAKDSAGLTQADRIAHEFIEELAKDTIDRSMIESWNKPLAQR